MHTCIAALSPLRTCKGLASSDPHAVPLGTNSAECNSKFQRLVALACSLWCLAAGPQDLGNALECIAEVLGFVISLVASQSGGVHDDLDVFGLELMTAALSAAKSGWCSAQCPRSAQVPPSPCSLACRCQFCSMHEPGSSLPL